MARSRSKQKRGNGAPRGLNASSARVERIRREYGLSDLVFDLETIHDDEFDLDSLERPDLRGGRGDRYDDPVWSEVLPGLWQGGTLDHDVWADPRAKRPGVERGDFDTVVTLYASATPVDWFVKEIRYGVWDSDVAHIDIAELFDLVRATHTEWRRGKKVLVRCQAGWNRSGLVTALVLIREGLPAAEAIDLIREKRSPWALCNEDFVRFLLAQDPEHWRGDDPAAAVAAAAVSRMRSSVRRAARR